jgi:hypothetical protein
MGPRIVKHDIGSLQDAKAANGDERGRSGSSADQPLLARGHEGRGTPGTGHLLQLERPGPSRSPWRALRSRALAGGKILLMASCL